MSAIAGPACGIRAGSAFGALGQLLIRGFGVRVPGGAPALAWCFTGSHACAGVAVWAQVDQGMAAWRAVGLAAPPGRQPTANVKIGTSQGGREVCYRTKAAAFPGQMIAGLQAPPFA